MTTIEAPEGFVEFSMQVMSRAVKLREEGKDADMLSVAYTQRGKAIWINDGNLPELIEVAARALLLAMAPNVIEGEANA